MNEDVEELMESLYLFQEEHREFTMTPRLHSALEKARAEALVEPGEAVARLTRRGSEIGREILRRHRLSECLLQYVIADSTEYIHDDACSLEHLLQHGLTERVCTLLGHPRKCPDGKTIPEGDCCTKAARDGIREVSPLCDGNAGEGGTVAYFATTDDRTVGKLLAMGVLPGAKVRLVQSFPAYVFQSGFSQFAVDRAMAETIYVRWDPTDHSSPVRK